MIPDFQVIVVGAGHAGCEAALGAAKSGAKTLLLTLNLDTIASMPCNPSIGGQGKGQLVREIDALGGEMGVVADETAIQSRLLNTRKGLAVQSLRVQSDKRLYGRRMASSLMRCQNLQVVQGLVLELLFSDQVISGVITQSGVKYTGQSVILAPGTFLRGKIHIGNTAFPAGRAGEPPAEALGIFLQDYGFPLLRFKTGTPPRINVNTICFDGLEVQGNDPAAPPFSLRSNFPSSLPQKACFLTRTNEETHRIISQHMGESALFSGKIQGTGPRYCPSIEDKVRKFPTKSSHKVFLEPEGAASSEIYLQGMSTSLPEHVQELYVRSLPGLENARITRPGYAIEYDVVDPRQLYPTLEFKQLPGLFLAGQVNGTSGYEEAAAQGVLAGMNAAMKSFNQPLIILPPENSFTGLMIEEITSQGLLEPYRVFTSRSAFRLNLRMSNAEERLSELGFQAGVISDSGREEIQKRFAVLNELQGRLESTKLAFDELPQNLREKPDFCFQGKISVENLLKRPQVQLMDFASQIPDLRNLDLLGKIELEIRIKYAGYIEQQGRDFQLLKEFQYEEINPEFFSNLPISLSYESKQRILAVRPQNIGSLRKIPGIRASDVLLVLMAIRRKDQ